MSCGFQRHPGFRRRRRPWTRRSASRAPAPGSLGCNASYAANIGIEPVTADLADREPADVCAGAGPGGRRPAVLTACPPCTGFSRTMAGNHLRDDRRNGLVERVADYVALLRPEIVLIENARELVMGRFAGHLQRPGRRSWTGSATRPRPAPTSSATSGCRNGASGPSSSPPGGRCPCATCARCGQAGRSTPRPRTCAGRSGTCRRCRPASADPADPLHVAPGVPRARQPQRGWPPSRTTAAAGPTCSAAGQP